MDGSPRKGEAAGDATSAEQLWVEENCLEGTKEDASISPPAFAFIGNAHLITSDSKKRQKALVALGRFRIFVIVKSALGRRKVKVNCPLFDLLEVNGSKEALTLIYCGKRTTGYHMHCTMFPNGKLGCKKQFILMATTLPHFLLALRTAFDKIAPTFAASDTFKIGLNSSELLPFTPTGANSIAAGFLETYQAYCDLRKTPVSLQVISYLQDLVVRQKSTELNLNDIPGIHPSSSISFDLGAVFGALEQNQYFTSLKIEAISGHKDVFLYAANALRRNESLTRLHVASVDPCPSNHFAEFCQGLRFNPASAVQVLVLRGSNLGTAGALHLADALQSLKHGLPVLDISSCHIGPKGMLAIFSSFMRNFSMSLTITSLDISRNKCDDPCSDLFAQWLNAVKEYSPLQRLVIADLSLNYTLIGSALRHFKNLVELNVSSNKLDHAGSQLVRTVCEVSRTLATIDLSSCHLAGEHVALVSKAVGENGSLRSVRLNLAKNDFARKDCSTFAGFIRQCKNVAYLDLSHNKLNNRGMEEILQSLTGLPALHTLILDHACKSPDGQTAGALCSLVSQNPNIRALRLAGGWGPAMDAFLSLIAKNETLEVLDISDNKLGDKGAALIANLLTTNPILKRLVVDGNGFTISGFQAIALGLVTNTTLVQMDFPWQDFDKACSSIPSPKQPHLDNLRQNVMEVQVALSRNMYGHSSVQSFELNPDETQLPLAAKASPLAQVPAELLAVQNEAPPLPPYAGESSGSVVLSPRSGSADDIGTCPPPTPGYEYFAPPPYVGPGMDGADDVAPHMSPIPAPPPRDD
jgi:Ran GTPase-activating protein (RanGAP) involved in mRNA processing and transport